MFLLHELPQLVVDAILKGDALTLDGELPQLVVDVILKGDALTLNGLLPQLVVDIILKGDALTLNGKIDPTYKHRVNLVPNLAFSCPMLGRT